MAFATKEEIAGIMKFLVDGYTEQNVDEGVQAMAHVEMESDLELNKIPLADLEDYAHLLRSAEICYYIEMSSMTRETEQAFGIIGEETIGDYTKKYENGMPMFFFAQGSSNTFLELLPHETWRMRGYKYLRKYLRIHFVKTRNRIKAPPSIKQYEWTRGEY